ncbi:helix-turn-helix domain-containing protein [Streptomyces lunalinharesii]|uniref:OmpR/PhoB-type domain-containing protein n=1 Tax=Streptomyces lunalinharesii TaxID=333384 RepID=A0ABN3RQ50_9ACTN
MRRDQPDVRLIRWPAESFKRRRCAAEGGLRLLIVDGGAPPPLCADVREDWVRVPVSREDLDARVAALRARSYAYTVPRIDPSGALRFGERVVAVSPVETALLGLLTTAFRSLVPREELLDCLAEHRARNTRNALDLHITRLRRRIRPVGLAMQTVRGHGYILAPAQAPGP